MAKVYKEYVDSIIRDLIYDYKQPVVGFVKGLKTKDKFKHLKDKKKVFLLQTPTHSNLGDHAIAYAQKKFIEQHLPNYIVVEVPFFEVRKELRNIKSVMNSNDYICIHGGGNMGDMYIYEEYMRRYIIKYFKDFNVISMPQTISFSNTKTGEIELQKTIRDYKKSDNVKIVARETKSYEMMKEYFGEDKVILTPDIVLSLDKREKMERKNIVTCLRADIEKALSDSESNRIFELISKEHGEIIKSDTTTQYEISIEMREEELEKIWNTIRSAEVVITDRLHGMIFCAITATPCIVFKNSNHKIEQSYNDWLSDLDYIKFCDVNDIENITTTINELKQFKNSDLEFNNCREKYTSLLEVLKDKEV